MRQGFRSRLTYANVMATLALFIALGGGAYAAFHLPRNSVSSKNIVNRQVKRADLATGAVTSRKLGANSVTETKVRDESLTGDKLSEGAVTGDKVSDGSLRLSDIVVGEDTATIDFGSLAANACATGTVSTAAFSEVQVGDVSYAWPAAPAAIPPFVAYGNRQEFGDQARFAFCNTSETAADPPPIDFRVIVLR
jgi:hypothetical protein